ncbi:class I SAM-dependent RNA methyltransferase [Mariprofundus sp. EBB-1]|uniref:THUMP domain-containing class I SAM-dependent RNA methyltransferase n=1 Tax=Mariprofundus sp. EBB-1 TaxID=2650971 RepID=UPI000EF21AE8|nr:class I SAM-dependent RNA methyltransferase [Mariprofundus sp. EBB-1]RLL49974.1 class I SAM-dependent RNA methyltransferase [Mariprofundus sp. EBB-1]
MRNLNCYAVVVPGLEGLAADELHELAAHDVVMGDGGIAFTTSMDGLFRINLRSRCITRVLLRLSSSKALTFPELYHQVRKIGWQHYLGEGVSVDVKASCHRSKLLHSGRAEQAVLDGITASDNVRVNASGEIVQQVMLRIDDNICTVSIDTSGERLDRRGYRKFSGLAPVRETIAASILRWMQWTPDEPLIAPMCGSGTFAIEAALIAGKKASGLQHEFPFVRWPNLKQKRWQRALQKAESMHSDARPQIFASDLAAGVLDQARENATLAGVFDHIVFAQLDARQLTVPEGVEEPGLIVCNPPYGDRVKGNVALLYRQLGKQFKQHFPGWKMAVMVPDQDCEKALGLPVKKRLKIKHGGKWLNVLSV